jgi:hypothetical protein
MATPMRKDSMEEMEEGLSTADLAGAHRPIVEREQPQRILATRKAEQVPAPEAAMHNDSTPLFADDELDRLRSRWKEVQTGFVDEPRKAVEEADGLVASAMKRLAEGFAEERSKLEQQWDQGDSISTEDLRVALQRYRTFFHRLLSV